MYKQKQSLMEKLRKQREMTSERGLEGLMSLSSGERLRDLSVRLSKTWRCEIMGQLFCMAVAKRNGAVFCVPVFPLFAVTQSSVLYTPICCCTCHLPNSESNE